MKKIFAILMAVCMLANVLCVTSFAALLEDFDEIPVGAAIRVSGLKKGSTTPEVIKDYYNLVDGWNAAIEASLTNNYSRIVVDFYSDWFATDGEFCNDGEGFSYDAIYVPENARITLNLNGHTINRAMTTWEYNGEVMCIDENADVIINEGTIKGGWSCNGAGGIHVKDDAKLTLNDVHIVGNTADDDDGGGIALYDGAILIMNGGSFRDNRLVGTVSGSYGGAVYVNDSTAVFTGVEFKNNLSDSDNRYGVAVSAVNGTVTFKDCTFEGNGLEASNTSSMDSLSIIYGSKSSIMAENCTFNNNRANSMIRLSGTYLTVNSSAFKNISDTEVLIKMTNFSEIHVMGTTFADNKAYAVSGDGKRNDFKSGSTFRNCTLKNTNGEKGTFKDILVSITFYDCTFSGCKNDDPNIRKFIKIENTPVSREEAVIGVTELREDGSTVSVQYYKDFASGWVFAMNSAKAGLYDCVVVDFYDDWNTNDYGVITIPENARMILNLGGHKIDRDMGNIFNGEVIYISTNADVIINDGTIAGGYSGTGAGGIHINDRAKVVLNNVTIKDNYAVEGANGSAIAVYNGAVLVMNGGSISNNHMSSSAAFLFAYGTLYVNDATATLNNVTISNNKVGDIDVEGAAIYADNSTVTLNDCVVSGNINVKKDSYAESVIGAEDSTLIINNTDFTDNGKASDKGLIDYCVLFDLVNCKLTMTGGKITGNNADKIFYLDDTGADITGVTITGNESIILDVENDSAKVTLTECTLGNNNPTKEEFDVFVDTKGTLVLDNCELGDTTFENKKNVDFVNGGGIGSIFGEGSMTNILLIISLVASGVSIFLTVYFNKKKTVSATANNTAENADEE